jgi:hypothetical protein
VLLANLKVSGVADLDGIEIPLADAEDAGFDGAPFRGPLLAAPPRSPRRLAVIFGAEGVGKTTLLSAIASTRPGHAVSLGAVGVGAGPGHAPAPGLGARSDEAGTLEGARLPPFAAASYVLGDDDPGRPHPLLVVSPNARLPGERDDVVLLRRREQALFDRRAVEGGFALLAFSGARWFSRTPVVLANVERGLLRHDPRAAPSFDDATRADLTRETKQILAFSAVSAALVEGSARMALRGDLTVTEALEKDRLLALDTALREVLAVLLADSGATYLGASERSLEPAFAWGDREVDLDDLPRSLRHRVAFGALTVRALSSAYPRRDPRTAEGVVLLDDLEIHQDPRALPALPALLRRALPRVQWIIATSSPLVAAGCEPGEVLALRRMPGSARVELHQGPAAVVH